MPICLGVSTPVLGVAAPFGKEKKMNEHKISNFISTFSKDSYQIMKIAVGNLED